ncbi:hypothetical protein BN871_GL_00050 [Paenibacillus sp. P22]|nr:hypothetical protein BN871_GL_00050 [Paenibacillus sp. P22]
MVGIDRIGESPLLADFLEQPGAHAAAEGVVEQDHRVQVVVGNGTARERETDMVLLRFFRAEQVLSLELGSLQAPSKPAVGEAAELGLQKLQQPLFLDVARDADDRVLQRILFLHIPAQVGRPHGSQPLFGTQDGISERMVPVGSPGSLVMDLVVRRVLVHGDLFEDDVLFLRQFFLVEPGVEEHVRESIDRKRQMLVEHLGEIACIFLCRERIHIAPDAVEQVGDILGAACIRAFEEHMLDKMGDTVVGRRFAAGSRLDPNAERYGTAGGNRFRDNAQTVAESIYIHRISSLSLIIIITKLRFGLNRSLDPLLRNRFADGHKQQSFAFCRLDHAFERISRACGRMHQNKRSRPDASCDLVDDRARRRLAPIHRIQRPHDRPQSLRARGFDRRGVVATRWRGEQPVACAERILEQLLGARDLRRLLLHSELAHIGMRVGMIGNLVACRLDFTRFLRIFFQPGSIQEKGRLDSVPVESRQHRLQIFIAPRDIDHERGRRLRGIAPIDRLQRIVLHAYLRLDRLVHILNRGIGTKLRLPVGGLDIDFAPVIARYRPEPTVDLGIHRRDIALFRLLLDFRPQRLFVVCQQHGRPDFTAFDRLNVPSGAAITDRKQDDGCAEGGGQAPLPQFHRYIPPLFSMIPMNKRDNLCGLDSAGRGMFPRTKGVRTWPRRQIKKNQRVSLALSFRRAAIPAGIRLGKEPRP